MVHHFTTWCCCLARRYPGGRLFNLFNLGAADSQSMFDLKVKEVKNGRLAMVAWLGFMVQACTTHKSPVQNLLVSPFVCSFAHEQDDFWEFPGAVVVG